METELRINNLIFPSGGLINIKEKSSIQPHLFRKTRPFNHLEYYIQCRPNINPNNSKNSQNKVNRINRTNRQILIKDQLKVNLLFKVNKKSNSKIKANLNKIQEAQESSHNSLKSNSRHKTVKTNQPLKISSLLLLFLI